jgi:solute carrier family 25 (mitochondrial phosphate transporter), member 3
MSIIFPTHNTLREVFGASSVFARPRSRAPPREPAPFSTWSAIDDAKDKAEKLTGEAAKEFEKASKKAQQKAGPIELYSAKYYAACVAGGILACVCFSFSMSIASCWGS